MSRQWACWQCGACCKVAGLINPKWDRGDGVCKMLTDNKCRIYRRRPKICRIPDSATDYDLFRCCNELENHVKRRDGNIEIPADAKDSYG